MVERIKTGHPPNRKILSDELEVDVRTIGRDLEFLRERLGAPLVYSRSDKGYVLTEDTWFLPEISLSEGELFGLLVARQAVAQYRGTPVEKTLERIFDKVAGALRDRISVHPDYGGAGILSFAPSTVLPVREEVWNRVLDATRNQHRLSIRYRSLRSRRTKRRNIDPYHVINMQGDWYLFAYDHSHAKVCQFQLHRIEDATSLALPFDKDPNFSIARVVNSSFGSFGSDENLVDVVLRIRGEMAALLADRQFHPTQEVHLLEDGFEIRFPVSAAGDRPFYHLQQWILSMGGEVDVLQPPELRKILREESKKMLKNFS